MDAIGKECCSKVSTGNGLLKHLFARGGEHRVDVRTGDSDLGGGGLLGSWGMPPGRDERQGLAISGCHYVLWKHVDENH